MQMSAVDLRITAHFTPLASHGAKTSVWSHSVAVEAAAMGGHTATYDKMETSRSVRRPESGTWQSGSNGRRGTGTQVTLWAQQQRDQAVRGPMADMGLASA
ncbi:unnamed protein product [Staurois parvus]|uniref:Uncharacterized protein n=1 Tax=Staurois parvus TaxID=386267 RepID=A0ABN9BBV3_9NEOB|nr:unnamed protein product [Staurois parvus]